MNDKYNPPRMNEDFTEEEFDRLLESKFGTRDDLFSADESGLDINASDMTPAQITEQETVEEIKIEIGDKQDLAYGDPYDYTIPETREAWIRLKSRVGELEEANQDLRNQLDLRDEMDSAGTSEEDLIALRQKMAALNADLKADRDTLAKLLEERETDIKHLIQEKEVLTKGLEREQSNLNQELLRLMGSVGKAESAQRSLQEDVMRLEKELLEKKRLAEDERQQMQSRLNKLNDESKKKEKELADLNQQAAAQLREKTAQIEKMMKDREQEYHSGVLALQKEKKVIMDELKEQLNSLQSYVGELEKDKEEWGQIRDQLTMKVGLLEDEKQTLNEQNVALVSESQAQKHDLKEFRTVQKNKRDELKKLMAQMANLLEQS